MPFDIVYCSQCAEEWPTYVAWGIFKYRLPDGAEFYAERNFAWCRKCGLTIIEDLPEKGSVTSQAKTTANKLRELKANTLGGRIRYLLSGKRQRIINNLRKELSELCSAKKFLNLRRAPPRCFYCGSVEALRLHLYGERDASEGERCDVPIGFKHPDCGGELNVRDNGGLRIALALTQRFYDVEGNLLEERPDDHY